MTEVPHPASSAPTAPVLRLVEWIASDPESGVLRLRGEFADPAHSYPVAPVLVLRDESGSLTRRTALNEDSPNPGGWRAAYLIAGALLGGAVEKWLEWPDAARVTLPDIDVSAGDGRTPAPPPERGAEVFDRAVLAERRARRAESAQRAQARTAEAAVAALGALERRVEALTRERDALAQAQRDPVEAEGATPAANVRLLAPAPEPADARGELAGELETAREAARAAEQSAHRQRQALDEALGALGRLRVHAAELRLRMRIQMASASADAVRLAVLEHERRGFRTRLHDLRVEVDALRARVAGERSRGERLAVELEGERSRARAAGAARDELRAALAGERRARSRAEQDLESARAAARENGARVAALEARLEEARSDVDARADALRRQLEDLQSQLRAERATRASLAIQLRVSRSTAGAARAEAAARASAHSRLRRQLADALAEAEAARARPEPARERPAEGRDVVHETGPERRAAVLEAELADTRAALEAARSRLRRAAVAAPGDEDGSVETGAVPAAATAAAEPPRPALDPDVAARLRRRVADLQSASGRVGAPKDDTTQARPATGDATRVAERLDAAAASLRAAVPGEADEDPPAPASTTASSSPTPASVPASPPTSSLALAVRPSSEVVVAGPAPVSDAPAGARRRAPALRGALVRLAVEDPFAAARLLAALLPAQGAFLREDVDYDLTIRELGTFAVTVAGGMTTVRALRRPRSRRQAEMHLTMHALTLAELLAGRPRRVGRLTSPVRLRGSRRGFKALAVLAETDANLAQVARAGAALDPSLLVRVLPHLVDPADTDGHSFTVAQEVVDTTTRTWYLTADGRRGLKVSTHRPEEGFDAQVTMTRATFDRLLRAEPLDSRHKPWIRGDFAAVEALRRWIDAAARG